ncbi:glycosyltransferase [Geodermatophilus sp. SYSU D00804]
MTPVGTPLRIAHVVPYVSQDGGYGGPVAVAVEQSRSLAAMGHQVSLLGGWDGQAELHVPGVEVHLERTRRVLPSGHFSALFAPGVARRLRELDSDIAHLHLPRDLTVTAAALRLKRSTTVAIAQTHGMVTPSSGRVTRTFDRFWMRPALRGIRHQVVLHDREPTLVSSGLVDAHCEVHVVPNGVRSPESHAAWQSPPEVLYCSRLHPRKRPQVFVELAARLLASGVNARFSLIGADEGSLAHVMDLVEHHGMGDAVRYEGALPHSQVIARLTRAQCFVLPSVDEPFPMALLEALSVGLPSVLTDSTGISDELRRNGGAHVTDGSVEQMTEAVRTVIESDASGWSQLSAEALGAAQRYSADKMRDRLVEVYQAALSGTREADREPR